MELDHHPLVHEFEEYRVQIHQLKVEDSEFHDLMKRYDEIDKEIYRIEQDIEPASDVYLEVLKKKRIFFRDKIYDMLMEKMNSIDVWTGVTSKQRLSGEITYGMCLRN